MALVASTGSQPGMRTQLADCPMNLSQLLSQEQGGGQSCITLMGVHLSLQPQFPHLHSDLKTSKLEPVEKCFVNGHSLPCVSSGDSGFSFAEG